MQRLPAISSQSPGLEPGEHQPTTPLQRQLIERG